MWYQRFEWKPGSRNSSTDTRSEWFVRKHADDVLPKEGEEIYFQGRGGPVWRAFFRIPQIFVVLLALAEIELSIHVACVNDAWGNLASWSGIVTGIFLLVAVFTSALDIANSIFYITERRIIVYHRAAGVCVEYTLTHFLDCNEFVRLTEPGSDIPLFGYSNCFVFDYLSQGNTSRSVFFYLLKKEDHPKVTQALAKIVYNYKMARANQYSASLQNTPQE